MAFRVFSSGADFKLPVIFNGPDPSTLHLLTDRPRVTQAFEVNVLYYDEIVGDRVVIGRFGAIAIGRRFIMNGANDKLDGVSSCSFPIRGRRE